MSVLQQMLMAVTSGEAPPLATSGYAVSDVSLQRTNVKNATVYWSAPTGYPPTWSVSYAVRVTASGYDKTYTTSSTSKAITVSDGSIPYNISITPTFTLGSSSGNGDSNTTLTNQYIRRNTSVYGTRMSLYRTGTDSELYTTLANDTPYIVYENSITSGLTLTWNGSGFTPASTFSIDCWDYDASAIISAITAARGIQAHTDDSPGIGKAIFTYVSKGVSCTATLRCRNYNSYMGGALYLGN